MTTLVPIPIPGTDREIIATVINGKPVVSLRHACDAIGIDFSRQVRKLREKSWAGVVMMSIPSAGGDQQTAMIDRRTFTMWLATIDTKRVSESARPVLEAFQADAADALDAYFHEGGAINPNATEDQLGRLAREARTQIELLHACKGIIAPAHLEAKARLVLARAMGEAPELDESARPLYVWDFLKSKGVREHLIGQKAPGFGKRLKARYIKEYDREPGRHHQQLPNGTVREVFAYTEADRHLFESVWAKDYATKVSDAALTLVSGGDVS